MSVQSIYRSGHDLIKIPMHPRWQAVVFSALMLIALAIAYQPVMFNFFTSDDFYIIAWLHSIKHNPALLFQGVYEGTPYYRPLTNLIWFAEYLLCGTNSWWYRVIAIIYKLLTTVVLGFLLAELLPDTSKDQKQITTRVNWSLFSASLFLLYPLHTEPINWFVSTTEALVNLFILSGFLFYIYWRKQGKISLLVTSCAFAICAFLSKETAVILPLILVIYEYFNQRFKLFANAVTTLPYWFLLSGYLLLRKSVTGNFLGTWSDTVFHFTNNQMMFKAWLQSLKTILIPLSSTIFNHNHIAYCLWLVMLTALTSLTVHSLWKNRSHATLGIFIVIWFFISLLPMLKLLWITPNLLNARYGYIASVPLCAFLMFGLAMISNHKIADYWRYVLFFLVLAFSTMVLRSNNLAWAEAGRLTNSMRYDFARIHKEIAGDPKIYFFNIPDQYKGVPIAGIKTIQSMNHIPFSDKNFDNGLWLLDEDQLEAEKTGAYFYRWNMIDKRFDKTIP